MNQPTVKFSKEFITPSGLKEWVGIEWPVDVAVDKDAIFATLDKVRDAVLEWHSRNNPFATLDTGYGPGAAPVIQTTPKKTRSEVIIDGIAACVDKGSLKTFEMVAKQYPEAQAAYDKKFAELF